MKEYVIHVTKTDWDELDGTWFIVFSTDKSLVHDKQITFCAIRKNNGEFFIPHAGCSVRNPKDEDDLLRGERTAFKRAVESITDDPIVMARFRGALWIAMGRPGYQKSRISSNIHKMIDMAYEGE